MPALDLLDGKIILMKTKGNHKNVSYPTGAGPMICFTVKNTNSIVKTLKNKRQKVKTFGVYAFVKDPFGNEICLHKKGL